MKKTTYKWIGGFATATILAATIAGVAIRADAENPNKWKKETEDKYLSHQQETWIRALEWCESNGKTSAINPKDLDNTPSYGSFQFKPDTMYEYGIKYGIWSKQMDKEFFKENLLMNSELQSEIVGQMIFDKRVNFRQQFPACTKKLGLPPAN